MAEQDSNVDWELTHEWATGLLVISSLVGGIIGGLAVAWGVALAKWLAIAAVLIAAGYWDYSRRKAA